MSEANGSFRLLSAAKTSTILLLLAPPSKNRDLNFSSERFAISGSCAVILLTIFGSLLNVSGLPTGSAREKIKH